MGPGPQDEPALRPDPPPLSPNREMLFFALVLPHRGHVGTFCCAGDRTNTSKFSPQSLQRYS